MAIENLMDGTFGRNPNIAVEPPDQQLPDFTRTPVGLLGLEPDNQALDLLREHFQRAGSEPRGIGEGFSRYKAASFSVDSDGAMGEVQRQQINALSAISWRTIHIARLTRRLSGVRGNSARQRPAICKAIAELTEQRTVFVRFLVDTGGDLQELTLRLWSGSSDFLDEISRCGLLPLPELLSEHQRGAVSPSNFALAVSGIIAQDLADGLPDGDPERENFLNYTEIVEDRFLSAWREFAHSGQQTSTTVIATTLS
jgi:hypothetical protein